MMTTTKFTNNVVRAKAVKLLKIKRASSNPNKPGSKFTNEVHREAPPKQTKMNQSLGTGKSHTMRSHIKPNTEQYPVNKDNQVIRGVHSGY